VAFVAIREIVYLSMSVYMCDGFCKLDVLPSPKFQDQLVGLFDEESVNETVKLALPLTGEPVKLATGAGKLTVIVIEPVALELVIGSFAEKVYVYTPILANAGVPLNVIVSADELSEIHPLGAGENEYVYPDVLFNTISCESVSPASIEMLPVPLLIPISG